MLAKYADLDNGGFDDAEAARGMAEVVRGAGRESALEKYWLGERRSERLALAFDELAKAVEANQHTPGPRLYSALAEEKVRAEFYAENGPTGFCRYRLPRR